MQSTRTSGMVSPKGSNPLAPQGEWIEGRIGGDPSSISDDSALGQAMIQLGYKKPSTHRHVTLTDGSQSQMVCTCGYDTGMELVHDCVRDMTVHQVYNELHPQCTRSASAVGVAQ